MKEDFFGLGFHFFSHEDLAAIHDATLEVMGEVGIRVGGEKARRFTQAPAVKLPTIWCVFPRSSSMMPLILPRRNF